MFYSYLLEIRNRLLLVVFGWFFTAFISYFYKETLLFLLIWNFFVSFQNFLFIESITLYFEAKINEYLKFYYYAT
jgi:hypothetical protein